jgi:hypothetical protein
VILDGDGQHDGDDIPRFLPPLRNGAQFVIGSRFISGDSIHSNKHPMPSFRAFGIKLITRLLNFGLKTKVTDCQSGYRAFSREAVNRVDPTEKGMCVSIEVLVQALKRGCTIAEIPISCYYEPQRLDYEAFKHGFLVVLGILKIRIKYALLDSRQRKSPADNLIAG